MNLDEEDADTLSENTEPRPSTLLENTEPRPSTLSESARHYYQLIRYVQNEGVEGTQIYF